MLVTRKFVIDEIINLYRDSGEYSLNLLRAMEDEYNDMSNFDLEDEYSRSGLCEEEDFEIV